jgi:hypothetical protein
MQSDTTITLGNCDNIRARTVGPSEHEGFVGIRLIDGEREGPMFIGTPDAIRNVIVKLSEALDAVSPRAKGFKGDIDYVGKVPQL